MESKILVYTDGASRNNQLAGARSAGIGYRICGSDGRVLEQHAEAIGPNTNNEAEYLAIIKALQAAAKYSKGEVALHSDSELVVNQLKGKYKIKKAHLLELYERVKMEEKKFKRVSYSHVPRENQNITAVDLLINIELDRKR